MNRAERRQAAKRLGVDAAASIAKDIAEGRLDPDALEAEARAAVRELAGTVVGPDDPIWPVQLEIARGVLALDGIPYNDLVEWVGVHRDRPQVEAATAEPDGTE